MKTSGVDLGKTTLQNYSTFVTFTLCELTLFNCKRRGETQRMKMSDLKMKRAGNADDEILKTLTKHIPPNLEEEGEGQELKPNTQNQLFAFVVTLT